jgi:hypothetical protein
MCCPPHCPVDTRTLRGLDAAEPATIRTKLKLKKNLEAFDKNILSLGLTANLICKINNSIVANDGEYAQRPSFGSKVLHPDL